MTTATTTHSIAVKVDAETRERMKRLADVRQRSTHWIMREAIQQYLEREEKREAFRQGAINAWQDYQETGLHVTADEMVAWLDTWGETNEQAAPICHQ